MTHDELSLDPDVRQAVLNLFRANHDFQRAYTDWMRANGPDAEQRLRRVGEAERSVDRARNEVVEAQQRARGQLDAPPKQFDPGL